MSSSLAQSDRVGNFSKTLIRNMDGLSLVGRNISGTGDGGALATSAYTFNALSKSDAASWLSYLTFPTGGAAGTFFRKSTSADFDWAWSTAAFLDLSDTPASYSGQSGKMLVVTGSENSLTFTTVPSTAASNFLTLTDTPTTYTGQGKKLISVSVSENALVFTTVGASFTISGNTLTLASIPVTAFLGLADTPASYSGQSGKMLVVNGSENSLIYTTVPSTAASNFLTLTDTPATYSGQANKLVSVSSSENALVFTAQLQAANPTARVGTSTVSGSATTFMRSDAAPAINQSISPTWSGTHIFSNPVNLGNLTPPARIQGLSGGGGAKLLRMGVNEDNQSSSYYQIKFDMEIQASSCSYLVTYRTPGDTGTATPLLGMDITNGLQIGSFGSGGTVITNSRHHKLRSYTVASLPSASNAATMIYVSDESGGAVPAFADGTNWRRVTDRAIVS